MMYASLFCDVADDGDRRHRTLRMSQLNAATTDRGEGNALPFRVSDRTIANRRVSLPVRSEKTVEDLMAEEVQGVLLNLTGQNCSLEAAMYLNAVQESLFLQTIIEGFFFVCVWAVGRGVGGGVLFDLAFYSKLLNSRRGSI